MQSDFEVTSSVSLPATCQTKYLSFRLPRAASFCFGGKKKIFIKIS